MTYAQKGKTRHTPEEQEVLLKQFADARRTFLVNELQLTDEEVVALMPILSELDEQKYTLWKEGKEIRRRIRERDDNLTEEELRAYFERNLDNKVREAELERIYYKRCSGVLPISKLVRLEYLNKRFVRAYFADKHKR